MNITIIGAGRMGAAIACIFAAAGHRVSLVETNPQVRATVPDRIAGIDQTLERASDIGDRIQVRDALTSDVAQSDFVIEAVSENLEIKQAIFKELDRLCPPSTILASNTSVIPITSIGLGVNHRHRVVGTHFWNPPFIFRLVEVVQTESTSPEAVERTMSILKSVGQEPVHIRKDVPGFVGNRLQHALKREAIALVEAGVCDAETVDFVVKNSFGPRLAVLGPLEQSDLVGLDLTLAIHQVLLETLDCSRAPQKLLVERVAAGKTGMKAGEGFRKWTREQAQAVQDRLLAYKPNRKSQA